MMKLNDKTFHRALQNSRLLVMFSAAWAGPCNLVRPIFEEIEQEHPDTKFAEFDIDDNPVTPAKYGVRGIPNFVLFIDGIPSQVKAGALTKEALASMVDPTPEKKVKKA